MSELEQADETKKHDFQVLMTIAAFLVSILAMVFTCNRMDQQVEEMKRNTELEFRPLLLIEQQLDGWDVSYMTYTPNEHESQYTVHTLDTLPIESPEFDVFKNAAVYLSFTIKRRNTGKYPLWIKKQKVEMLTYDKWIDTLGKSHDELVERLLMKSKDDLADVDRVIFSGDSATFHSAAAMPIPIERFIELVKIDSSVVVYLATYIEYCDYAKRRYNTLRIDGFAIGFDKEQGKLKLKPPPLASHLEKYVFDGSY